MLPEQMELLVKRYGIRSILQALLAALEDSAEAPERLKNDLCRTLDNYEGREI